MPAQAEFLAQVRDALNHLHDYPYLETHALALRFWPEERPGGPNRAHRLHRLLLETIEALNPPAHATATARLNERYLLLVYRYVEGREVAGIMRELGYSRRQFFREQRKALLRLAALLWEKLPQSTPTVTKPDDLLAAEAELVLTQRELVRPTEVVPGVLDAIRSLAEQHGVTLECEVEHSLPAVYANRTLLRQVLLKVLSELITRPGTRRVHLRLRREGGRVTFELLASPGSHVSADRRAGAESDLALASTRRLVEMMGGQWQGHRSEPASTICRFNLPSDAQSTLLTVEDNEAVVRAYRRYLAGYGYQVVGASSGQDALRLARELGPVAIALDIMMPSQDGWEILQALKNDPATRHIPVIICSVLDDPELARSLGAVAYLHKPITQADLLSALAALEGRPERSRTAPAD